MSRVFSVGVVGIIGIVATTAQGRISFDIDYSKDTSAFFSTSTTNGQKARATLERAADTFADRFLDSFTELANAGQNHWEPYGFNPSTGNFEQIAGLTTVAANTLKVYAGGRVLPGSTVGQGGPGGASAGGFSQAYIDNILSRGQPGAIATPATDVASWGGSIAFDTDSTVNWNYDFAASPAGKTDLLSIALHEFGHMLGIGSVFVDPPGSYDTYRSGLTFIGEKAKAVNGGVAVPLDNNSHLSSGITSTVTGADSQQPALSPSILTGTRKLFTLLDWAVLDDIGWDLARPGDANADAAVGFDDLLVVSQNYNSSGSAITWSEGDFNYDGSVSFDDLLALAQNYNGTGPLLTGGAVSASFAADWALAQSLVPEPTLLTALLALPLASATRRRRLA